MNYEFSLSLTFLDRVLADIPKWKCQNISKLNTIGQEALILNRSKQR